MCQVPVHLPPSEAGGKGICTSSRDSAEAKRLSGSLRISGSSDRCGRFGRTRSQCLTGWNGRILSGGNGGERSAFSPSSVSQCGVGIRRANSSQKGSMSWCGVPWCWFLGGAGCHNGPGLEAWGWPRLPMYRYLRVCFSLDAPSARDSGPFLRMVLDRIKTAPGCVILGKKLKSQCTEALPRSISA